MHLSSLLVPISPLMLKPTTPLLPLLLWPWPLQQALLCSPFSCLSSSCQWAPLLMWLLLSASVMDRFALIRLRQSVDPICSGGWICWRKTRSFCCGVFHGKNVIVLAKRGMLACDCQCLNTQAWHTSACLFQRRMHPVGLQRQKAHTERAGDCPTVHTDRCACMSTVAHAMSPVQAGWVCPLSSIRDQRDHGTTMDELDVLR